MASHGVEGEGVDSRWEAGHVTHLLFPVGSHGDGAPRGPQQAAGRHLEVLHKVEIRVRSKSLAMWGTHGRQGGLWFTGGKLDSTFEELSNHFSAEERTKKITS